MISRSPGRVSLVLWIYAPTLCQCLGNRAKSRHILGVLAILSQEQKTNLYALRREYGILLTPLNHVQVVYHVHLTPNKKYTPSVNGVYQAAIQSFSAAKLYLKTNFSLAALPGCYPYPVF